MQSIDRRPKPWRFVYLCDHCGLLTHAPGLRTTPHCDRRAPTPPAEPIRWALRRPRRFPWWKFAR